MRLDKIFKTLAPAVALAALGTLAACDKSNIHINGIEGVPLAELDMSGEPPDSVVLAGPDKVTISEGSAFRVTVEGDEEVTSHLRFSLKDGTLGISRDDLDFSASSVATVLVIMPPPKSLTMAGSGRITSDTLASEADVTIAGSGTVETPSIDVAKLNVTIAGSGAYNAGGKAASLNMTIGGSGKGRMQGLKVEDAELNIAGSGNTTFASDGTVEANIMGSGDVTVHGSARCTVNSLGSGTLTCERGTAEN